MSTNTVVSIDSKSQFEEQALTFGDRARALVVQDQVGYNVAAEMLLGIKDLRKKAEEHHRPMIDSALKAHRATLEGLKRVDAPLEEAERIIKPKLSEFLAEQERKRLEQERILREQQEAQRIADLESSIEAAEAEGATAEEVAAIIEQPAPTPVVHVAPTVQPVSGVSTSKTYRAELVSIRELCKAVAMGSVPETYVTANMPALNGVARSTRGAIKIPGIRIAEESTVRAGRR